MRILFFGTPEFAEASLAALYGAGAELVGVVTRADKPRGRGMKTAISAVKAFAEERGIPVYQPETLKDGAIEPLLRELAPELIVVVAYGKILPGYVLDFPKYGCVNVHGSLLPAYRGAAPIQRAIINGEKITGVTTMYMDRGLDTGDIILQDTMEIGPDETFGELHDRMKEKGAALLLRTLEQIEKGEAPRRKQDDASATYAPTLSKSEALVDWSRSAQSIHNQVRGQNPWPGACACCGGKVIKLLKTEVCDGKGTPGEVLSAGAAGIEIACGKGSIRIHEIQPCGGRRMKAQDFCNGHKLCPGDVFQPGENADAGR